MPISNELEAGEAYKKVSEYDSGSNRRLLTYLGLAFWLCDSVLGLVMKSNFWHALMLIAWFILLGLVIRRDFKERKVYLDNLATLEAWEKERGSDVPFKLEKVMIAEQDDILKKLNDITTERRDNHREQK